MNVYAKLANVQSALKAPKGQYNSFGKYKYRSCEDIVESVKPLLKKEGLLLNLTDTIEQIGDRYYVKATAIIIDTADGTMVSVESYAREEETKKGMDGSQVTGASSSYARKYALNGIFAIDDTKDSDSTNTHEDSPQNEQSMKQIHPRDALIAELNRRGMDIHKFSNDHNLKGEKNPEVFAKCLAELVGRA